MNTKEKLFNSMYDLIGEVGYDKASINQICNNAGIKKSSFYYFYESKESLFKELIEFGYDDDDIFKQINKILNISSKNEYKKTLINLGSIIVSNYKTDLKWRRVVAEVELQALRNDEIKLLVDVYNDELKKNIKNILNHGVLLNAFNSNFDIELNTNILCILIHGVDNILLSSFKLDAVKVFEKTIERMFL